MGPKERPVPKPHARSVIAKITKTLHSGTIHAQPKPRPPLRPPPRSLRIISGYPHTTSSSSSRTQAIPLTQTDSDSFESGVQKGLSIDLEHLVIPDFLKFPLSGQILPADPAQLKDKTEVERSVQNQRILDILKEFHGVSTVAHQLGQSKFPELHMRHLLRNLEPETVKRHLNKFLHFVNWLKFDGGITMDAIQPFHIADYLMDTVPSKKNAEWRFKPAIGSLTWTSKTLGLQQLANSLESDLIKSFFASKSRPPLNPDIMPVTLGLIFTLETLLKQSDVAIAALPLGAFLLMFWAGLRYSDIQRVFVADIHLSDGILRGKTWKSKSRKTGMSFSCITAGLTGTHSKNWATIWLSHLTKWWSDLSNMQGMDWKPDFLIPTIYPKTGVAKPQPMAHYQASIWLRLFLERSGGIKPTLHGLKAGLVAIGKQLTLPDEWLAEQAHHAPKHATATYTRDDTYFQLRLQVTVMQYLQKGWRPLVPQSRGSSHPVTDAPFSCVDWLTWEWLFPNPPPMPISLEQRPRSTKIPANVEEVDSSSSSTSSTSEDSDDNEAERVFLLNNFNMIAHNATRKGNKLVPSCGASMGLPERIYIESKSVPSEYNFCNRRPCIIKLSDHVD